MKADACSTAAPEAAERRVHASLLTARNPGAIAIVAIHGDVRSLDRMIASLCGRDRPVELGSVALRRLADLDEGLVARLRDDLLWLMPHGGVRIVERIAEALRACDVGWLDSPADAREAFPEAADAIEAQMLSVLAEAASPLAFPLLLDQPRRWREREALADAAPAFTSDDHARWQRLDRLIEPPRVCVIGPPNAGKSTLLNTLAGRGVALASPIAGTTRDFVSTRIDLAGLVVEWIDLPGFRAGDEPPTDAADLPIEARAVELARAIAREADLLVLLAAPEQRWATIEDGAKSGRPVLRVMSKADLPEADGSPRSREADLAISAATGGGIADLVRTIRDTLVPPADLEHPGVWRWRSTAAAPPEPCP